jgi:hypothetical protein
MIQENELLTLIMSIVALVFILGFYKKIQRIPGWQLLIAFLFSYTLATCFTVLEGFLWPVVSNQLEHFCHLIMAILLCSWCIRYIRRKSTGDRHAA